MDSQRSHGLSEWLYHTQAFTRFYGQTAGKLSVDLLWDDFLVTFLNRISDGSTLLEVVAGPGLLAVRILETRPDLRIIVTDFSPNMLELAKDNLAKAAIANPLIAERQHQLEYVQANAMDLSMFRDRKIDGIYSMGAIKHFPDPLAGLYQAKSVLADGGIFYTRWFLAVHHISLIEVVLSTPV